ncbi:DUF86 domain-containing protein [Bacteroidia bacterium]|nr:DUF86 domain-containing protein [Bacteroidia bacterium]
MYDKTLVLETLQHIEDVLCVLIDGTADITDIDELSKSADGMLRLNGICMGLFAVGEEVKNLDKRSNKELLPQYPSVPWRKIMGLRDIIAHHYFEIEAEQTFTILRNDVPPLLDVIRQMQNDLNQSFDQRGNPLQVEVSMKIMV